MNRRDILRATLTAPLLASPFLASRSAFGQATAWPTREITMIQPVGAGVGGDLQARTLMAALKLDVPVVSKNLPAAAGAMALRELVNAKPDGYTLSTIGIPAYCILPRTTDLGFDPFETTAPVAGTFTATFGIAVPANSPIKTADDLVALAKTRRVNYSSALISFVVAMYKLASLTGGDFNWVRTSTSGEAATQVAGGHVDAAVLSTSDLVPQVKSGTLRLIASASKHRFAEFPEVKTLQEQGYDAYNTSIIGWAFPKGVPEEIRLHLETLMGEALKDPALVNQINALGVAVDFKTGAEFKKALQEHAKELYPILVQVGMAK